MDTQKEQLKALFNRTSKHSNYQILPECLKPFLDEQAIEVKSRYEKERLDYILQQVNPAGKSILDIGGNTGYFSIEFLDHGAGQVDYYEGNAAHAEFVQVATELLGIGDRINICNEYYAFSAPPAKRYDITLLLNVLHHVGDDYGDVDLSMERARAAIIESINSFSGKTGYLVFQLGFCWKGNRNSLLFEHGTKEEMINFIRDGIGRNWQIQEIAVPERENGKIVYNPLNEKNIQRDDSMGEFLNRPLFILKSLNT